MKLEEIGFYTLCDDRAKGLSETSPMWRCEMILTDRCNFNCPYCRGLREDCRGDMSMAKAVMTLNTWAWQGLKHVRFSGGEPMLWPYLEELVTHATHLDIVRIALSTNGSFPLHRYADLVHKGVNDFSISLDACCASEGGKMAGVNHLAFTGLTTTIRELAKMTYVTVGVVLTDDNIEHLAGIVQFAHDLGVADIRIIPAAQNGNMIQGVEQIPQKILDAHPILAYRVRNILAGLPVRSILICDCDRCYLPIDDSVVAGNYHFPCVIYMREQGDPIGKIGPNMRQERIAWSENHNTHRDPICRKNCLDVCLEHNTKCHHAKVTK
jgi:MoaA/NifB/PqqE/SkfB family radical SAM enzyme